MAVRRGSVGGPVHTVQQDCEQVSIAAMLSIEAPAWHRGALCAEVDPESFFPQKGGSTKNAKEVCKHCPVVAECLTWALDNDERHGIWGGLAERERRKMVSRGYKSWTRVVA